MWVGFVVGSRPCSSGFPPSSKINNLIVNSRATGLSVSDCYVLLLLNKVDHYHYHYHYYNCYHMKVEI